MMRTTDINSEDPARLVEFYTRVLGEPCFSDGGYTGWMLGSAYITVGLHAQVKGKSAHPGRIIWNIESQDVKADSERFKAAGATVSAEPYGYEGQEGSNIATFADPDDNYFQVIGPMRM